MFRKRTIKTLSLLLAAVLFFTFYDGVTQQTCVRADTEVAVATDDYTQWKQFSATWGHLSPWKYNHKTFKQIACWITSMAMLLRHYDVVTESDVTKFNPVICNERMMQYNIVAQNGHFVEEAFDNFAYAYPGVTWLGDYSYSYANVKRFYNKGYAVIVHETRGHYVLVHSVGKSIKIMDPGHFTTSLTQSDFIQVFKISTKTARAEENRESARIDTDHLRKPAKLIQGNAYRVRGKIASTEVLRSIKAAVYDGNGNVVTGKVVKPDKGIYDLERLNNAVRFSKLKPGVYRYCVTVVTESQRLDVLDHVFAVLARKQTVDEGTFLLHNAKVRSLVLDSSSHHAKGNNVQLEAADGSRYQRFQITYVGDGYYHIKNVKTKKYLGVKSDDDNNVKEFASDRAKHTLWQILPAKKGYCFVSKVNPRYIMAMNKDVAEGENVRLRRITLSDAVKFRFSGLKKSNL